MKKILHDVLILQCFLAFSLTVCVLFTPYRLHWTSFAVGGGVVIIMTLCMRILMRHTLTDTINARLFLMLMIVAEIVKWLVVNGLTFFLLQYFSAFGIVTGFSVVYVVSYMGILWKSEIE